MGRKSNLFFIDVLSPSDGIAFFRFFVILKKSGDSIVEQACELLTRCGFFKKYSQEKRLACKGFINLYCKGEKLDICKRKAYLKKNGSSPSDDMMPNGQMIRK